MKYDLAKMLEEIRDTWLAHVQDLKGSAAGGAA